MLHSLTAITVTEPFTQLGQIDRLVSSHCLLKLLSKKKKTFKKVIFNQEKPTKMRY